jgi:amino acid adenylation domain-containing protein
MSDFSKSRDKLLLAAEKKTKERTYWLDKFAGNSSKSFFPTDYSRHGQEKKTQSYKSDAISSAVPDSLYRKLKGIAVDSDELLHILLVAGLAALLFKFAGKQDILLGTTIYKQSQADQFLNTRLPLGFELQPGLTFKDLLVQVRQTIIVANEHQNYPMEILLDQLGISSQGDGFALFEIALLLTNIHDPEYLEPESCQVLFLFDHTAPSLSARIEYNALLYNEGTIQRIIDHYFYLLEKLLEDIEQPLSRVSVLTPENRQQILFEFNDTATDFPGDKSIHEIFAGQVQKNPHAIALVDDANAVSYGYLDTWSTRLAADLIAGGVRNETIVALIAQRSSRLIAGILAILNAGAAYLPIDASFPGTRKDFMLNDSHATHLLVDATLQSSLDQWLSNLPKDIRINFLGDGPETDDSDQVIKLESIPVPHPGHQIAYIMYTSGSTGQPKGTLISHRNVIRVVKNTNYIDLDTTDRILQLSTYSFDGSVFDIYGALLNHAALVLVQHDVVLSAQVLTQFIKSRNITVFFLTTALFNALVEMDVDCLSHTRKVLFGGERVSVQHSRKAFEHLGPERILHVYGPTETTVYASYYAIDSMGISDPPTPPIGKPIANTLIYILDQACQPVPIGVSGEIYIGGDGVARGYLNRVELTAEKFITDPFRDNGYLFQTGDLARWLPCGNIEFQGRRDFQVKIRGFRIEPGEIETQLMNHQAIEKVSVLTFEKNDNERYLCAFFVATEPVDTAQLKTALATSLPDYMIPTYFIQLPHLPLNQNGKIDRSQLPVPHLQDHSTQYEAPTSEIEEILVQVWQEVLGIEKIGVLDNFFDIGGDSIKTIHISAKLQKFNLMVKINDFFLYPTIRELSPHVKPIERVIEQGVVTGNVPLTPIQNQFFQKEFAHKHRYVSAKVRVYEEHLDVQMVANLFNKLIQHHDALRMVYEYQDGRWVQFNRGLVDDLSCHVQLIEWDESVPTPTSIQERMNQLLEDLNLQSGPLLKVAIVRSKSGDALVIMMHHLVIDPFSWRVIFEDIDTALLQLKEGKEISLPLKTDSFKRWAEKLQAYSNSEKALAEIPYWKQIDDQPVDPIFNRQDPGSQKHLQENQESVEIVFSPEETEQLLREVNWEYNTEIDDILLTALGRTIQQATGGNRFLINLTGLGREPVMEDVNVNRTVGWFTSQYPILLDMTINSDDETDESPFLAGHIKQVKETRRKVPNRGIGYGILKELTDPQKKQELIFNKRPLIHFNYLGQSDE